MVPYAVAGVYVSYPFCNQKCSFCNFASDVGTIGSRDAYLQALCAEISAHNWTWQPETLYLGGGTPSLLEAESLAQVLQLIPIAALREFTIECAPGTLNRDLVHNWHQLGVNRVSLGVQSFVERELRQIGRRHNAETVASDVQLLRSAGILNFNIDLIAGLPHQTSESWNESLACLADLDPPHVSVYLFEMDEDSRLGKELILGGGRYGAGHVPPDDLTTVFYERACERLARDGRPRYEISNFAKPGFESLHNLKYWRREPYIGFGLDAHSFDGYSRWGNPAELPSYQQSVERKVSRDLEPVDSEEEHFFVGLRLERGIQPSAAERTRFATPIKKWRSEGFLMDDGVTLRLSAQGMLLSNEILQEFIDV